MPTEDGGDLGDQRILVQDFLFQQTVYRVVEGDPGAADGGGAGPPVGLYDVAIRGDGAFPQGLEVYRGSHGTADQALDLQGPAALPSVGGLPRGALAGGTREQAVFGGDPAAAAALQKTGYPLLHAGRAQHPGGAEFRIAGETAGKGKGAQLVRAAQGWSHRALAVDGVGVRCGGRSWVRTSDPCRVKTVLSH